ncbi:MAG: RNA polymerase factor sigma-54 [Alphaproteobacteria bacterium]
MSKNTSGISQRLDLRQSQQLVMTPQLQQAIKLLQLSNMELSEFIDEEIAQNPLLEKAENSESANDSPEDVEQKDSVQEEFDDSWTGNDAAAPHSNDDFDAGSSMANMGTAGSTSFDVNDESFENRMSAETSLRDHLLRQLHMSFDDPRDRTIGALLIDQIDESGYLRLDIKQLTEQLAASQERIEHLLSIMKTFDPAGVFAAGLAECLAIQLAEKDALDEPMRKLLENLDLIAKHGMKKLADICGVNPTYLADMIAEIRTLNPKPAAEFDHLVVQTAVPDVLMKRQPTHMGGGWRVELNNETLPRVLINQEYYTLVSKGASQKKDKEYLTNQMQSANWLVKALDSRAQTILKTAASIVEQQEGFFNYGIEFLKPLTLKDIAAEIQMHESTVSRVTTGKYIGTPRGIFELKFFFSTAIENADGSTISAESVRARISDMINIEDPENVLSDDEIVQKLKDENIDIARRTVAKYREGLGIPSSVLRRRQKSGG